MQEDVVSVVQELEDDVVCEVMGSVVGSVVGSVLGYVGFPSGPMVIGGKGEGHPGGGGPGG